jgi:hypothetical protein
VVRHPRPDVSTDHRRARCDLLADGSVHTSAGVTAGIDLALALVEEDLGADAARDVAQQLVVFLRRPGGQSQFSAQIAATPADREPLREVQAWIAANVGADLSVPALAARARDEPTQLRARVPPRDGDDPAAYVESVRVEQARIALEGRTRRSTRSPATAASGPSRPCGALSTAGSASAPPLTAAASNPIGGSRMKVAIPVFERVTALDAIGPYEVLSRLPGAELKFVSFEPGPVKTDNGMLSLLPSWRSTTSATPTCSWFPAASARGR